MSQQSNVTREDVYRVADSMVAEGLKPSVRNVQTQLGGGSHSTITRHLKAWRERQGGSAGLEVPGTVLDAIGSYINEAVARKTQQLSQRLESTDSDLAHLADLLGSREREIESLRSDLAAANDQLRHVEALAANRQAELQRLQELLETKAAELQETLQHLAQTSAQAEAARAMTDKESLRPAQLEESRQAVEEQMKVLRAEKVDLERRLAAEAAECRRFQNQVTELTRSLERSASAESDLNATLRDSLNDLRQQLERERQERVALADKLVQLTTARQECEKKVPQIRE